jgi:hypothetical protein
MVQRRERRQEKDVTSGGRRPSEAAKCCFFFLPPSNNEPRAPRAALRLMTQLPHCNHTHHGNVSLPPARIDGRRRSASFPRTAKPGRPMTDCAGRRSGQSCGLSRSGDWHRQRSPSDVCNHPCHWLEMLISSEMVAQIGRRDERVAVHCTRTPSAAPRRPLAGRRSCMLNEWLRWFECARLVGA